MAEKQAYRFRLPGDDLIVPLVHGSKIVHGGEEDVDLDDVPEAAPGSFEDRRDVGQRLLLDLGATVKPPLASC